MYAAVTYTAGPYPVDVQPVTFTITGSASTITLGDTVTLTATMTPHVSGKTVTFYDGSTSLGTDATDASGVAVYVATPSIVGVHNYYAKVDYP